ncbi:MAG: hypothetical protein JST92_01880, partial [Deltaproteobacteria bacterium]|nr:hypothetical protein [Deltaproteobacteria bacterium]
HVDIAINQTGTSFKNDIDAVSASGDLQVTVSGGPGDDTITGQASNGAGAFATAFSGSFTAYGAAGNDTISPGASTSSLWGGIGNDTFVVPTSTANTATVAYFGEAGTDTIDFSHRTTHGVTIHMDGLASSAPGFAATGTGATAVNTAGGDTTAGTENMVIGDDIEVFNGSAGGDKVFGSVNGVTFNGGAGNDWFVAPAASTSTDVYKGGAGIDTVDFSLRSGALTITMDGLTPSGAAGEKDLIGSDVENFIGGQGDDTIIGNALDNVIDGQGGNDVIYGGDGDDTVIGGAGNNVLYGGNGDDTFMFAYDATSSTPSLPGNDTGTTYVNCGAGNNNTLDFSHETSAITIDIAYASTSTSFNGSGTIIMGGAGGKPVPKGAAVDTADSCNNVFGGSGANTIYGNSLDNILDGNSGAGSATSTIDGRGGVDTCINFGTGGSATHCEL